MFKFPNATRLDAINMCIYCGATERDTPLTDEHIIPYCLGGNVILPKSSCKDCARITAQIEGYTGRHIFQDVRIEHNFPTRNPKQRPTELPLKQSFLPTPETAPTRLVPVKEYPGMLMLLSFEPAGILIGKLPHIGSAYQIFMKSIADESRTEKLSKKGIDPKIYREIKPDKIARLVAKIALGMATAQYGVESFVPEIRDVILKNDHNPYYMVGGTTLEMIEFPQQSEGIILHKIVMFPRNIKGEEYLVCQMQLFAYLGAPIYTAVVGKITDKGREHFTQSNQET